MSRRLLPLLLSSACAYAASPPILARSLASQLVPDNPAISSAFLVAPSSALLANASTASPALRIPPSWSFSIGFSGATFLPGQGPQKLSFDARLDNGDPLPEWLNFSTDTITFGGVAPKEAHGVQVLNVVVTAASSASSTTSDAFMLIVASHDLSLSGPLLTRNVTADNKFSLILDDFQGILLDGAHPNLSPPSTNNAIDFDWATSPSPDPPPTLSLALDTASFPWLTYVPTSRTLSGTPPASYANVPGPSIPALVTLAGPQSLTVSTNLTLAVLPASFSSQALPPVLAPPGTAVSFVLAPFLTAGASASPTLNVTASWDPLNATWLVFNAATRTLNGTVPFDAPTSVKVTFEARDATSGTLSRAEMLISIGAGRGKAGGDGNGRTPTNRALQRAGKKTAVAVGVVFGVLAGIILLASFLAVCRRCCATHEVVDGAYVIDQSAFDGGAYKRKGSLEKSAESDCESGVDATYLHPRSAFDRPRPDSPIPDQLGNNAQAQGQAQARTMPKAAFFSAVRERFGSDGSWRGTWTRSGGGGGKRARKSKISKPMVVLSSSTSVREGFGDKGRGGARGKGGGIKDDGRAGNFTIFGGGGGAGPNRGDDANNSGSQTPSRTNGSSNCSSTIPNPHGPPPPRPPRADLSLSIGRVLISPSVASAGSSVAVLAYDRSRSNSDPSRSSVGGSLDAGGSVARRSGSAPSLGTGSQSMGTRTGTQSTFATGDSTRLTNAAGEVPFRRPGFDGLFETLAERSMRETGSPQVVDSPRSPGVVFPPRAVLNNAAAAAAPSPAPRAQNPNPNPNPITLRTPSPGKVSPPKVPLKAASTASTASTPSRLNTPPKAGTPIAPSKSSKTGTPPKPGTTSRNGSPLNPAYSASSKFTTPPSGIPTKSSASTKWSTPLKWSPASVSKPASEKSLGASLYRNMFFGDKGNESDSSAEDVEHAVIKHAVKRSSSETPGKEGATPGKPRLVAFTHARTPAASAQDPRRNVSQRVVLQGSGDSDPETEMRIGLEYVRQLGHPESNRDVAHARTSASMSRISSASDPPRTTSAEFYASNDSNDSIAGRTRVLAPLVISSHRNRHQAAHSMASTRNSFMSFVEREGAGAGQRESRWMIEAALPCFTLGTNEPFNFPAPLDRPRDKNGKDGRPVSALAGSALEAKLADGSALPEWLRFDKAQREFWGVPPKGKGGVELDGLVTRVVVRIWEGEKGEVVGGCVIDVVDGE